MEKKHNKNLVPVARMLRKNMTKEEKHLWYDYLQKSEYKFTRQKIIGKYIADFYCPEADLIIEIDGSQHYTDEGIKYDAERTEFIENFNITVIRIKNTDINRNFIGVCTYLENVLREKTKR
ncbi:MAG: endonuclease domain-containing protein [Clostridia bacterium]|nr:endonuclease domain-containing protein [Clostridia bacterium]